MRKKKRQQKGRYFSYEDISSELSPEEGRVPIGDLDLNPLQFQELARAYIEKYGKGHRFTKAELATQINCYIVHKSLYILKRIGLFWFDTLPPIWDVDAVSLFSLGSLDNLQAFIAQTPETINKMAAYDDLTCAELEILTRHIPNPNT